MANNDILLDNFDLKIANGDLVIGESNDQDMELIALTNLGEWKRAPLMGAGVARMANARSSTQQVILRDYTLMLKADGFINIKVNGTEVLAERSVQ